MLRGISFFQALKPWLLSVVVFGLLAVLLAGQLSFTASMPLRQSLVMAASGWLPWALVTPLLFRLVFAFPLERGKWKTALPVHLLAGTLMLLFVVWTGERIAPTPLPSGLPLRVFHLHPPEFEEPEPLPPPPMHGPETPWFFHLRLRLPIFLAIVSIAHAFYFYRRGQDRERRSLSLEASLARARLETLRLQLQPHFLFNSLNAIAELIHKDPEAADGMLVALGDLLRATLETTGTQELPLHREAAILEKYLSIEKARFGERLLASIDIPQNLRQALVPTLLLQPIVENAVRHGLEPRPGKGCLSVRASREGDKLRLAVSDDGLGLPGGKVLREGVGLGNTRARLEELYGSQASISVQVGPESKGVAVDVLLPYHESP